MRLMLKAGNTAATYEIRDIQHPIYGQWRPGVVVDVPADEKLTFIGRYPEGDRREQRNAVEAILSCGPNFVDAETGVNPNYACAKCGVETTSDMFGDPATGQPIAYANADGKRLCIACFLDENPQRAAMHEFAGYVRPEIAASPAPAVVAASPVVAAPKPAALSSRPESAYIATVKDEE